MKTLSLLKKALYLAAAAAALSGCGTKVGTGRVNVAFSNETGAVLSHFSALGARSFLNGAFLHGGPYQGDTPTIYQMKLVALYLVEDIDANQDNVGAITRIWTSAKCDADLTLCGIGPSAGNHQVDYFDFAAGTEAVNQTLNSYRRDIEEANVNAGTYRYIRLDFQGATGASDPSAPNLKFGTGVAHEVRAQVGAIDVELPQPLVIAEGDSFTVNLAYDLEGRFYDNDDPGNPPAEVADDDKWTCDGVAAPAPCIVEAPFSPTVVKE